jgi:hypothetical protein
VWEKRLGVNDAYFWSAAAKGEEGGFGGWKFEDKSTNAAKHISGLSRTNKYGEHLSRVSALVGGLTPCSRASPDLKKAHFELFLLEQNQGLEKASKSEQARWLTDSVLSRREIMRDLEPSLLLTEGNVYYELGRLYNLCALIDGASHGHKHYYALWVFGIEVLSRAAAEAEAGVWPCPKSKEMRKMLDKTKGNRIIIERRHLVALEEIPGETVTAEKLAEWMVAKLRRAHLVGVAGAEADTASDVTKGLRCVFKGELEELEDTWLKPDPGELPEGAELRGRPNGLHRSFTTFSRK